MPCASAHLALHISASCVAHRRSACAGIYHRSSTSCISESRIASRTPTHCSSLRPSIAHQRIAHCEWRVVHSTYRMSRRASRILTLRTARQRIWQHASVHRCLAHQRRSASHARCYHRASRIANKRISRQCIEHQPSTRFEFRTAHQHCVPASTFWSRASRISASCIATRAPYVASRRVP
jgi:hypothetical protein